MAQPSVLIVEDDPRARNQLEREFGDLGFSTLAAAGYAEAKQLLSDRTSPPDPFCHRLSSRSR